MGSLEDNEVHLCDCGIPYKSIKRSEYKNHAEEMCEECGTKRFIKVSESLKPHNYFYYFDLKSQIESLFRLKSFRSSRTKGRDEEKGIYMSVGREWLQQQEPGILQENRSIWSIGVDGAQPFDKRCHSCTQIVLKCEDMGIGGRYKDSHTRVLAIVPGPTEPTDLNPYLCYIGAEMEKYRKEGMKISYKEEVDGEIRTMEEIHHPVWAHIYADAKAREKILLCKPGTALKGCFYCWQISTQFLTKTGKRSVPAGWLKEAKFRKTLPTGEVTEFEARREETENELRATEEELRSILNFMKEVSRKGYEGEKPLAYWQQAFHVYGHARVFEVVPTLHIQYGVVMPLYHLLLLGNVKRFILYLLDGFRKKKNRSSVTEKNEDRAMRIRSKKLLEAMEKRIFLNSDYRKPYSPVANCYSWICEEILRFVEVHSSFLFEKDISGQSVLTEEALVAWRHLRAFTMYYIRDSPASGTADGRLKAHEHLRQFGKICEGHGLCDLLTPNLHSSDCQLPFQEMFYGSPFMMGDMWVERAMRKISSTQNKNMPEATLALGHRRAEALERAKLALGLSLDHAAMPKYRPRSGTTRGNDYDKVNQQDEVRLLGKGVVGNIKHYREQRTHLSKSDSNVDQKEAQEFHAIEKLIKEVNRSRTDMYQLHWVVWEHTEAMLNGNKGLEVVKSVTHKKETRRRSCYATITWEGRETVAIVRRFIRLSHRQDSEYEDMKRYAICDIYNTQDIRGVFTATEYQNEDSLFLRKNVPVELKDIGSKVQYNDLPKNSDFKSEAFEIPKKTFVRRIVFLPYVHHQDVEDPEGEGQ
jgi:hypothetical protein